MERGNEYSSVIRKSPSWSNHSGSVILLHALRGWQPPAWRALARAGRLSQLNRGGPPIKLQSSTAQANQMFCPEGGVRSGILSRLQSPLWCLLYQTSVVWPGRTIVSARAYHARLSDVNFTFEVRISIFL
jgi:hypothetical protein